MEASGKYYHMDQPWDELVNRDGLYDYLEKAAASKTEMTASRDKDWLEKGILPPIGSQEVWAAGVTYLRSRNALATTEAELKLIARAAIIGDSNSPVNGYRTPAAIGMLSAL